MDGAFRKWLLIFGLLILFAGCGSANGEDRIRKATHADDMWYPSKASELGKTVDGYLAKVEKEPISGKLMALIVPHAGYRFCGHVAAYAYKQIEGKRFDDVIVIGPSHRHGFYGASVDMMAGRTTPLGSIDFDLELAQRITEKNKSIGYEPAAHAAEHSVGRVANAKR